MNTKEILGDANSFIIFSKAQVDSLDQIVNAAIVHQFYSYFKYIENVDLMLLLLLQNINQSLLPQLNLSEIYQREKKIN